MRICVQVLGCRLVGFGLHFFPPSVVYPRDFSTIIPGALLVNEHVQLLSSEKDGWKLIVSPWGEGGRILLANSHAAVPERVCFGSEGHSYAIEDKHLQTLWDADLKTMLFPPPLLFRMGMDGERQAISFNDHLDRVACMICDKRGNSHLVVDPGIGGVVARGSSVAEWSALLPRQTIPIIRERASQSGISFHVAPRLCVPYSLNLFQNAEGRVLMTSGEDDLQSLIEEIVGRDAVFTTRLPIRYFPAWSYAGIRCLVNDAPTPLLKKPSV